MPPQYVIKITGDISWEGQANGLPKSIYAFLIYEGDDASDISSLIENQMGAYLRAQTMFVQRDQGQVIDLRETPQDRMCVPFRWIVKFHAKVDKLSGELSIADENGVERLKDGKKPLTQ